MPSCSRARYLRLPTAVPRQAITHPRGIPTTTAPSSPIVSSRRPVESTIGDDTGWPRPRTGPPSTPANVAGPAKTRRPEISPARSASRPRASSPAKIPFGGYQTRNSSPARSTTGRPPSSSGLGEGGRSRLWLELREVQRKSRPSSQRSEEPP